jgi:predicted HD phosphohydrolase
LRALFGPETLEPIRLHVDAKRFLCAREPGYLETLSADSRRSLVLQGGVFDEMQAQAFAALPFAQDAVRVRRWDDAAKSADAVVPGLSHFVRHMTLCAAVRPAAQAA